MPVCTHTHTHTLTDSEHEVIEGLFVEVVEGDFHRHGKVCQVSKVLPVFNQRLVLWLHVNTTQCHHGYLQHKDRTDQPAARTQTCADAQTLRLLYPLEFLSGVSPEAAMYVLPIVLIFVMQ